VIICIIRHEKQKPKKVEYKPASPNFRFSENIRFTTTNSRAVKARQEKIWNGQVIP
jgi:hypothetical protein